MTHSIKFSFINSLLGVQNSISKESVGLLLNRRKKAVSKWKKVNNTIKFINISKESVKKSRGSKNIRDYQQRTSKWTLVRIAISMVSFLTKKTKCASDSGNWEEQEVRGDFVVLD